MSTPVPPPRSHVDCCLGSTPAPRYRGTAVAGPFGICCGPRPRPTRDTTRGRGQHETRPAAPPGRQVVPRRVSRETAEKVRFQEFNFQTLGSESFPEEAALRSGCQNRGSKIEFLNPRCTCVHPTFAPRVEGKVGDRVEGGGRQTIRLAMVEVHRAYQVRRALRRDAERGAEIGRCHRSF